MKKLVILLLVFSLLTLTSCGLFQKAPEDVTLICETANKSKPTKVFSVKISFLRISKRSLYKILLTPTILRYFYNIAVHRVYAQARAII